MKKIIAMLALVTAVAAAALTACNKSGEESEYVPDSESPAEHVHSMQYFPEQEPTCTTDGHRAYYLCGNCGGIFEDEKGEKPLTDRIVPSTGHKYEGGYCENCEQPDPKYAFAQENKIVDLSVDENGVLSWSKIRYATKYEIVYAIGDGSKSFTVDKRAAKADVTALTDYTLAYGKNYLTVKAFVADESGNETQADAINVIVKNLNSGYEVVNADYTDKFVTATGFTADENGAIHKDVVVDGRTMPTIKTDISVSDGYTLAFYYTASDRENDLNRINRFTSELKNGENKYYAAILSGDNLVKTYDIVLHGVKDVGMEFAKETLTTESDGTKVSSLEYFFTQKQKTARQGDYIDINGLYEKIPEGYVIRDDSWNIYEKGGDYIMPYDSADVNCYYAAEEKTVRAEADEFNYYAQTFYINKVNDRSNSHYDYMNNKYVFKFELTPKIYDDKGTEIVYNELYVPGEIIGNKTQVSSFGFATVKRLIIGRGITTLPQQAFYNVKNLEYVALPNTLTSVGNWLFPKAQKGTLKIYLEKNSESGFSDKWNYVEGSFDVFTTYYKSYNATCTVTAGQYSIAVGENGATVVGADLGASRYLEDVVREVRLGYKTYKVTGYADNSLSDITDFTIPSFIEEMNLNAFSKKLINISVDKDNENYSLLDGILYNKEMTEILYVPGGYVNRETLQLADNIVAIQDDLFVGRKIQNVAIGKNTTQIGANAFKGCPIETISGVSVQKIGDNAFYGCPLKTVNFPSLKTVGESAFYGCNVLTAISFADDAESIGNSAFSGCRGLTSVTIGNGVTYIGNWAFYNCSGLMSVTIGNSITTIGVGAFSGCSGLTSVTIGNSVTTIGARAFEGCRGLTSITIPDGVTSIGDSVFYNCSGLTSITIPDGVTSIGSSAFSGCSGLESITLSFVGAELNGTENTHFGYIFGASSSSQNSNYVPSSLKTVIISNDSGVTSIGARAFYGCSGLTSITIPDSVTTICNSAFYGCRGLTSITIPDGVTSIGDSVFYNCSGLTSITIPDGITSIGVGAFSGCSGLTSITIPDSVTSIGSSAFRGCGSLKNITLPFVGAELNGTENTHFGYIFGASSSSQNSNYVPSSLKTVIISNDSSVTSIGTRAFEDCSGLTSITIPDSVTTIGEYAFKGCSGLTDITIPAGVTSIGVGAFSGCSGLTGITIPDGVTSIGSSAFRGCGSLKNITLPFIGAELNGTKNTHFGYIFGASYFSKNNDYVPSSLKTVIISNDSGVTSIGGGAFYNCSGLTSITIPDSVTYVGSSVFDGCSRLSYNEYGGARYLGNENNKYVVLIKAKSNDISYCNINENCKVICSPAFSGCSGLTSITIPDSVISIGSSAFSGCSGLTSITIPDSVISIGSSAFSGCSGLTSITIPDGVTSIGNYAFENCSGLTSVIIGNGVTSIGYWAFLYCSGLTSIVIPDSVTSIGNSAFHGCSGLTSVTLGNGVTEIGSAFADGSKLSEIRYNGTIEKWKTLVKTLDSEWKQGLSGVTVYCTDGNTSI